MQAVVIVLGIQIELHRFGGDISLNVEVSRMALALVVVQRGCGLSLRAMSCPLMS